MPRMARPTIDPQTIWPRYIQHRAIEDRNALVEHYQHLASQQALRLAHKLPARVSVDEIRSAAFDGLIQAVQSFDPGQNVQFEIYCRPRIVGAVMDWLRAYDGQSRLVRRFERRRAGQTEALLRETGRPPTPAETAARMGMPEERFDELSRLSRAGQQVHFSALETTPSTEQGDRARRWELADQRETDPVKPLARKLVADFVTRGLTKTERLVLILYYYEGCTMTEIGAVLGLSESRVSQIHKEILTQLRREADERLADELAA